jgi:hypothetical protein
MAWNSMHHQDNPSKARWKNPTAKAKQGIVTEYNNFIIANQRKVFFINCWPQFNYEFTVL